MTSEPRRGRRPGNPDTRAAIVEAARVQFAEKGYSAASLRAVARQAGVDPALVHHYFADKLTLFMATVEVEFSPRQAIEGVMQAGVPLFGMRAIATILGLYDGPVGDAIHEAFLQDSQVAHSLVDMILTEYSRVAVETFPGIPAAERLRRAALVQDVVGGLLLARVLLRLGPLYEMPADAVVAHLGPLFHAAVEGRLRPTRPVPHPSHDAAGDPAPPPTPPVR